MSFVIESVLYFQDVTDDELRELAKAALNSQDSDLDYRDDGFIELVLKILGLMCDGQNDILQVCTVPV